MTTTLQESAVSEMTLQDFETACQQRHNIWIPVNGGTETPFLTQLGFKVLYCFNPSSGEHAYIDLGSDQVHVFIIDLGSDQVHVFILWDDVSTKLRRMGFPADLSPNCTTL